MLQGRPRELVKRFLEISKAKLVFNRITQTRYTRFYFFLSAFSCLLLCALQAVILSDNTKAVDILAAAVDEAEPAPHITILKDGELHVCDSIPDRQDSNCVVLWLSTSNTNGPLSIQRRSRTRRARRTPLRRQIAPVEEEEDDSADSEDEGGVSSSDEEGGVPSDDEGGFSSDDEEDGEEDEASRSSGNLPTATVASSSSPTATVSSTTTAGGATSITISSTSGTSVIVAVTPTRSSVPTATGVPNPNSPLSDISLNQASNSPHSMRCIYSMSWLGEVLHDSQREDAATLFYHVWLFGLSLVAILNESLPHLGAAFAGHILAAGWSSSRIQGAKSLAALYRDVIIAGPCEGADLLGPWWEMRLAHTIPVVVFNILSVIGLGFVSYKLLKVYSAASFFKVGPTRSLQRVYKIVLVFSVGLQLSGFFTAVSSGLWLSKVTHGNFKSLIRHEALYIAGFVVILLAELPWLVLGWVCVRKECKKRFWVFAFLSVVLLTISSVTFGSEAYRTIFKSWRFFATVTVTAFVLLVLTVTLGVICYLNYGKGLQAYLQMTEELEGTDFDPVSGFKAGEKLPEKPFPASFYGYAPAFHEKTDAEWAAPEALPKPPTAAEVNQYLSRAAAPPVVHQPQQAAASNPFESDMDAAADSRMKSVLVRQHLRLRRPVLPYPYLSHMGRAAWIPSPTTTCEPCRPPAAAPQLQRHFGITRALCRHARAPNHTSWPHERRVGEVDHSGTLPDCQSRRRYAAFKERFSGLNELRKVT
ncbi:hypothetical protein FA13DRAFT_1814301 [Coprinellus micaceus]|uniref:Uncharacterized protein n=1 Tax=Coprinellus micaceus TaxID=71717 RepID=A0A4Y7T9N6_COPMI|nr:hypothetical protein FA13DRAFT_1814301 [Coprinellus micaceus]